MRGDKGLITITLDGRETHHPTVTCAHCNRIVSIKPFADPASIGGLCFGCNKPICPHCVGKGCDVIERKLERMEHRDYVLRSYADCAR